MPRKTKELSTSQMAIMEANRELRNKNVKLRRDLKFTNQTLARVEKANTHKAGLLEERDATIKDLEKRLRHSTNKIQEQYYDLQREKTNLDSVLSVMSRTVEGD